ncbi:MAG: SpoIIE family protein phosphatase [Bacteroidota bacterium]
MQNTGQSSGEDELIRLLLKRQSELNSLLEVTRAINKNAGTPVLIQMLEVILQTSLQIGAFRFLIAKGGKYICISKYGGDIESISTLNKACATLKRVKNPESLSGNTNDILKKYDYFIPIYHKGKAVAFALIGDFNTSGEMINNDLNFIQTLINVVVVALENKRLFRERLLAERLEREMELAAEVQNMLIPLGAHRDEHLEIDARYLPHQNVGGDYYDFIRLSDEEFLWCIADVSGKGVSAALLMANFQASLHAWATVEDDLTNIVERLNHKVVSNTKGEKFITLFIAKYNTRTRRLCYINAGHNAPILYNDGEVIQLKLGTTMIGAFEQLPFLNEAEIDIDPGSLIINYTDGLLDFEPYGDKVWDEDGLLDFTLKNGDQAPVYFNETLLDYLNNGIKGRPIDDITILTLRIF